MPSFDVVSKADKQEVRNAVDQALREIASRFDFRGSKSTIEQKSDEEIVIVADDKMRLGAVQEILKLKFAKRNVSLKSVVFEEPTAAGGDTLRQMVRVKQGLTDDELKKLNKEIKATKLKISSQIQGDQLRVTGKKRDDLQAAIAHLRQAMPDIELQFVNFRD